MQPLVESASPLNRPFIIGHLIEAELRRQERTVTWLSRRLNCDRRNIYSIFEREYIDTGLLFRISLALGKDFFSVYSSAIRDALVHDTTNPGRHNL